MPEKRHDGLGKKCQIALYQKTVAGIGKKISTDSLSQPPPPTSEAASFKAHAFNVILSFPRNSMYTTWRVGEEKNEQGACNGKGCNQAGYISFKHWASRNHQSASCVPWFALWRCRQTHRPWGACHYVGRHERPAKALAEKASSVRTAGHCFLIPHKRRAIRAVETQL